MTSLNISLPESMRAFVDEQVSAGGYSTASEYVRQLIREAQQIRAKRELTTFLLDGLQSGEANEWSEEDWNDIHVELAQRIASDHVK